tara:strand:- start:824 stop:2104 length:1281 start_codon:yes stop_codon:yes gene_type:complete
MGWIVTVVLFFSMIISVPVGISLGLSAFAGMLYVSPDILIMMPQKFLYGLDSFPLLAIPLFVLAGQLMSRGGLAKRIIAMALIFVGQIRGGLALVVISSAMLMSGISGSPSANTAAIGSVAIPAMKKLKYPPEFATAVLAAAGGVSTLVPPAIDLIIIGVIANISIGGLFAAGILPAVVNGIAIMLIAYYYSSKMKLPLADKTSSVEKIQILRDGILPILMIVIILGGIYGGVFTPTEAASVAVVYGFVVSFFIYKELTKDDLPTVLLNTASLTGVILLVLATASMFSFILTFERIPHTIAQTIVTYADNWIIFIILVHVVFLLLGMIMDALPAIIVLMPIFLPVAVSLGLDPIHFGILIAANVGIGMITPPVGICLFVACGISEVQIGKVVNPLLPFLIFLFITLLIITAFPQVTLFLPRIFGFI